MTCIIKRPDPQDLFDRTLNMFSANVLGGAPVLPDTNEWYAVSNEYLAQELWYSISDQMWRENDPRYACCDNLVELAALRGVYPRPANFSRGYVRITGTPGSLLSNSLTVSFNDQIYRVDAGATLPPDMPAAGQVVVRMAAEQPGTTGNATSAQTTTGTLVSNLAGIDRDVTIYGSRFCGGSEAETCEQFRTRYLRRLARGHRTRFNDMLEDVMEWPCITRVCRRECSCCPELGRLELFVFMENTFEHGIPPVSVLDEIQDWYFGTPAGFGLGVADFGVNGQFYAAKAVSTNISITNLPCTSAAQMVEVRSRVSQMFAGMCPGVQVCRRMVDAIVIGVMGPTCTYSVEITPIGSAGTFDGDLWQPDCDELPVAGTVTVNGGTLTI